ncbi:MAG: DUF4105 domain-containing protein [Cyclobacteriaceae bacterium]
MRIILVLFSLLFSIHLSGQQIQLSERAHIGVITCAPFQGELYSAFGHSAIRVYDPENRIDYAYNYGTFDFNQPNFYLNFTRGNLLYKLSVQSYPNFRYNYLYYNRWVHEQIIDLNQEQKQKLFDYLQWNAQPENQEYLYDYFYNNCATKIRDVFAEALGEKIKFDDSYITTDYSIRDLTELYLQEQPWGDLGIDICLGLPMDKKATPYDYMFLPDYIESSFNHASIVTENGVKPLVKETNTSEPQGDPMNFDSAPHPWVVFGILLVIVSGISFLDFKNKKTSKWIDITLLFVTGTIGCLLFILWVATDHKAAANNFNLLWALPTNLIAAFLLFGKQKEIMKKYYGLLTGITLLLLITWALLPQQLNVFLIPVVIALAIRYALNYYLRKKDYI